MTFFESFNLSKDSKIAITNLLSNITTRPGSHKGGWARLLKCQLKNIGYDNVKILDNRDSLLNYDTIIFDLGAEYSGALNLFGGLDAKVFKRLQQLEQFKGQLYSWRNELPDINILESRRTNASTCNEFCQTDQGFLGRVSEILSETSKFDHVYETKSLLIGDSHTPSVWDPSFMIERRDGRTLEGMVLNKTVEKYLTKLPNVTNVLVHCSSIDIRHHACRQDAPATYIMSLAQTLVSQLNNLGLSYNIVETVGIEDESRELPKTGYFKGTPFYGSWTERNALRQYFNGVLNLWLKGNQIKFPEHFFDFEGKLRMDVMEIPQSVHLSPEYYRWDLDRNMRRW